MHQHDFQQVTLLLDSIFVTNDFILVCIFRFLNGFRGSSDLHKEMLAILSAIAEVIKERNGTESSTEYFLALVSGFGKLKCG